ncbi:fructosyl amine:oxygen oxidoreductase [Xylariales sp. PMI_506]|nr:fructosyl amine:oxygen oxidoreductase [Xylariales sp. PMI_506]
MEIKGPAVLTQDSSILIVGAGTWGTAIAYRLAKRGYSNIKVLDCNEFPSAIAAGNDLNKILEEADSDPAVDEPDDKTYAWSTLHGLAASIWTTDPTYSPHYHRTGFIYAAVSDAAYAKVREACAGKPDIYEPLDDAEAIRASLPKGVLTGDLDGWRGYLRRRGAGWVEAQDALLDVHAEAVRLGVTFLCDRDRGRVVKLLYSSGRDNSDVVGALTADGTEHLASRTVLAAGASSSLLFDFEDQLRPTAWTLAHIALTPAEAASGLWGELPVLYGADRGFFISPPASAFANGTPEIKVCDEHPGYINLVPRGQNDGDMQQQQKLKPVPLQRDAIPPPSEEAMRAFLRSTVPQLADRLLFRPRLCWDADTPDRLFLLSEHPRHAGLVLAAGGSGNGFMCSPAVGVLVADLLEDNMDERLRGILRWRPETARGRDWFDTQGRFGVLGRVRDLKEFDLDS